MSLISKEHLNLTLQSIKKLLTLKADKSELVQPDWNQNDETAKDYVKNRTHYTTFVYTNIDIKMKQTGESSFYAPYSEEVETLSKSYKYAKYIVDNNEYYYTETEKNHAEERHYYGDESNPRVGFISFHNTELRLYYDYGYPSSARIVVDAYVETVIPIEDKFIPDTIARSTDIPVMRNGGEVHYGRSTTSASTAEKTVTTIDTLTKLTDGTVVIVNFYYKNTATGKLTLNVNNLGAKSFYVKNNTSINSTDAGKFYGPVVCVYYGGLWLPCITLD